MTFSPGAASCSSQGGRTTTPGQSANGLKCFFHSSRHASPTTSSRRAPQAAGSSPIAARASASVPKLATSVDLAGCSSPQRGRVALLDASGAKVEEKRAASSASSSVTSTAT